VILSVSRLAVQTLTSELCLRALNPDGDAGRNTHGLCRECPTSSVEDLYYPAPVVLVVGVTSKLREREYVLGLDSRCGELSRDPLACETCVRGVVRTCLNETLPPSPFIVLRRDSGYMCLCYNIMVLIPGVG